MKALPKVYAKRPACKWHVYNCHRPVTEGTLCDYHKPEARDRAQARIRNEPQRVASDPGCDCEACLRSIPDWS